MPPEGRTVYVDFDDVLCATARGFLTLLRERFGKEVAFEDIKDFDLGRSFDLPPKELELFFELAHEDHILDGFVPIEGALATVQAWRNQGFRIEVVTGRPPETRSASEAWLSKYGVVCDDLVFVDKYGHAPGGVPLDEIAKRDYAWVVEDSFETAARLALGGHSVHLLDRPWNRLESEAEINRCADWAEVRLTVGC